MKLTLFAAILFLQSVCFGHEYQRAEYQLKCAMTATKQSLTEPVRQLPKTFTYFVEGQVVDGKFLSTVRDRGVMDSAAPANRITEDYSTLAQRPTQLSFVSFPNPLAHGGSMYGVQIGIKSGAVILNESVDTLAFGLMRYPNSGAVDPEEAKDLIKLFNAFGETLTNPQDLVIESNREHQPMTARLNQNAMFANVMQAHFPETINSGASYHFITQCSSSLMWKPSIF